MLIPLKMEFFLQKGYNYYIMTNRSYNFSSYELFLGE